MNAANESHLRGKLLMNEPMSRHTSWRLGGPADRYYVPADCDDLQLFMAGLDSTIDLLWVGLGSNMLVRDGGFRGQVVAPLGALKQTRLNDDGSLYAECGVSCSKFAKVCQRHGFAGAEFFAGIPGTIGGALTMNAGAFGGETWSQVETVTMINRQGELIERSADEFETGYRTVQLPPDEWFVAGVFRFDLQDENEESNIRQLLQKRNASQPIGEPSCGSVFKNPPGKHAAQLIESSGLKGYRLGTARVSDKHANFIISAAETTSADVEALIEMIRQTVDEKYSVRLETEVRIVGEAL
ncbi:MAG: UDP-N-acetylmuramate dehydrogenase [Pseudomonadota bacterium]